MADGHIKGATVFLDINKNGIKDSNEPFTATDKNGNYSLSFEGNYDETTPIIAIGGVDLARNSAFSGKIIAPYSESANISPLTTLVFYGVKNGLRLDSAVNKVANALGINSSDVTKDPTTDENLQTLSLQIELSVELVADVEKKDIDLIYNEVSKSIIQDENLTTAFENLNIDKNTKIAIKALIEKIPEYVKTKEIANVDALKEGIKELVLNAKNNDLILAEDTINAYLKLENTNLVVSDNVNKIKEFYNALRLTSKVADLNDAKSIVNSLRNVLNEFYNSSNENDTNTIIGEVKNAYDNSIVPAVNNLSENISNDLKSIADTTKDFENQFKTDFNNTLSLINNRLKEISDNINEHNTTQDYNFTTSFNDKVVHKYENNNGIITEIYSINDQNITATYDSSNIEETLEFNGNISLSDENYTIVLDKIFEGNDSVNLEGNAEILGENDSKITASTIKISSNIDKSKFKSNEYDKYNSVYNPDIEIKAEVLLERGTFNGTILLNNNGINLLGKLIYNDTTIDGNITINSSFDDLKDAIRDKSFMVNDDWWENLLLLNNVPVISFDYYNYDCNFYKDGEFCKREVNLTDIYNNTAHCVYEEEWNITTGFENEKYTCDNNENVISKELDNSIVTFEINGKKYYLDYLGIDWANDINYMVYKFKNAKLYYDVDSNKSVFIDYDNGNLYTSNDINVSDVLVKRAKTVLDIPAELKIKAFVTKGDTSINATLAATSNLDGKSYDIYTENVEIKNLNNKISFDKLTFHLLDDWDVRYTDDDSIKSLDIKNLKGTIYDIDNNPINLSINLNITDNIWGVWIGELKEGYGYEILDWNGYSVNLDGNVSYLDLNLNGYVKVDYSGKRWDWNNHKKDANATISSYVEVNRENYAPVEVGLYNFYTYEKTENYNEGNGIYYYNTTENTDSYALFKAENNLIVMRLLNRKLTDAISDNGVIITIDKNKAYLKNINGNTLGTLDLKTGEIIYSDDTSETLY